MIAADAAIVAGGTCAMVWAARRGLADLGEGVPAHVPDIVVLLLATACSATLTIGDDAKGALLCASVAISALTDIRRGVVLDLLVIVSLVAIALAAATDGTIVECGLGALAACLATGAIFTLSRGGMGAGDVKLASVVGAALGIEGGLVALAVAFVVGGAFAAAMLVTGHLRLGQVIPFAPFVAVGTAVELVGAFVKIPL